MLSEVTGESLEELATSDKGFCDAVVVLRQSYRFAADSPIGLLAAAINQGDANRANACLSQDNSGILRWSATTEVVDQAARHYLSLFKQVTAGAPVETLFEELERFRLLCALRGGPAGAETLNQHISQRLSHHGISTSQEWYAGRPIMITRNDHQMRLYNGDIGLTLPDPNRGGDLGIVFMGSDGSQRWLAPSRLPPHESVYAMTVHKSQGSEFDEVLLLLPDQDNPVLSRELVYTAVTRARRRFSLAATRTVFETAVGRRLLRQSGLVELLISDSFLPS
jgi:exodeoxyribonuclease V alpha subunit